MRSSSTTALAASLLCLVTMFHGHAASAAELEAEVTVTEPRTYTMQPRASDVAERQARLEAAMQGIMMLLRDGKAPEIKGLRVNQFVEGGRTTEFSAKADFGQGLTLSLTSSFPQGRKPVHAVMLTTGTKGTDGYKVLWSFHNNFSGQWGGSFENGPVTGQWSALANAVGARAITAADHLSQLMSGMGVPRAAVPKADAFRP